MVFEVLDGEIFYALTILELKTAALTEYLILNY